MRRSMVIHAAVLLCAMIPSARAEAEVQYHQRMLWIDAHGRTLLEMVQKPGEGRDGSPVVWVTWHDAKGESIDSPQELMRARTFVDRGVVTRRHARLLEVFDVDGKRVLARITQRGCTLRAKSQGLKLSVKPNGRTTLITAMGTVRSLMPLDARVYDLRELREIISLLSSRFPRQRDVVGEQVATNRVVGAKNASWLESTSRRSGW